MADFMYPSETKQELTFLETKGFFVVFRFHGPLNGYIDKNWVLNDYEKID
jgi:hypothetical protein